MRTGASRISRPTASRTQELAADARGARRAGDRRASTAITCASRSPRRWRTGASTPSPSATTSRAMRSSAPRAATGPQIIENNTRQQIEVCTRGVLRQPHGLGRAGSGPDLHRRPAALRLDAARADPRLALAGRGHPGAAQRPADRQPRCAAASRTRAIRATRGSSTEPDAPRTCGQLGEQYLAGTRVYRSGKPVLHRQDAEQLPAPRADPPDAAERADHRRAPRADGLLLQQPQAAVRQRARSSPTASRTSPATTARTSS